MWRVLVGKKELGKVYPIEECDEMERRIIITLERDGLRWRREEDEGGDWRLDDNEGSEDAGGSRLEHDC